MTWNLLDISTIEAPYGAGPRNAHDMKLRRIPWHVLRIACHAIFQGISLREWAKHQLFDKMEHLVEVGLPRFHAIGEGISWNGLLKISSRAVGEGVLWNEHAMSQSHRMS
jgi:hypothetical protein